MILQRSSIRTNQLAMGPTNASLSFSLSLTVEASGPHIARVTFRLTITQIADLIIVKAKRHQNSIGYIMIPSISALTYEERLKRTGLISLENRRLRADLLEVFKILKGFVKVNPATYFSMSDRRSRGHTLKLEKPRARLDLRKHFFSNRVIDAWNALPGHMVEATTTNMFKAALQRLPHGAFKSWKQLPAPRGHLTT